MENSKKLEIKKNAFTSGLFENIWLKHHNNSEKAVAFDFIRQLKFIKKSYLPVYINVGKNLTNAMTYELNQNAEDFKRKVLLIYDVPEYAKIGEPKTNSSLKFIKARQYKGFMADLTGFSDFDGYMADRFNSKSRYKFRRNIKRLYSSIKVSDVIYYEYMPRNEYDYVFKIFTELQEKRYNQKHVYSNFSNLWNYNNELVYQMIMAKKAFMYVLYHGKKPICISVNFLSDKIAFLSTTVFDLDYSKFSVGYMSVIKCIKWCFDNDLKAYDFSKGYFHYKMRWSNLPYNFHHHIYYDSNSVFSSLIAHTISFLFKTKQFLRDISLNEIYNRGLFLLNNGSTSQRVAKRFELTDNPQLPEHSLLKEINYSDDAYEYLRKPIFDFLFLQSESLDNLRVYEYLGAFYLTGKVHKQKVETMR